VAQSQTSDLFTSILGSATSVPYTSPNNTSPNNTDQNYDHSTTLLKQSYSRNQTHDAGNDVREGEETTAQQASSPLQVLHIETREETDAAVADVSNQKSHGEEQYSIVETMRESNVTIQGTIDGTGVRVDQDGCSMHVRSVGTQSEKLWRRH